MDDHFLRDFLVVCLWYSACWYRTPSSSKKKLSNLSSTTLNFDFFWNWWCRNFPSWTLLLWFWVVMKHPGLIHSYRIAKFSISLPWNHVRNLLHTAWCAICSGVSKCGTHLHDICRICKSSCKIANALLTEVFKHCASTQTVILWSSCTILATVFCKTSLWAVLSRFTLECEQNENANAAFENHANVQCRCVSCATNVMLSVDCRYIQGNSHTIHLCRVNSLLRRIPNSIQIYHTFCLGTCPHTSFAFPCRYKPSFRLLFLQLVDYSFLTISNHIVPAVEYLHTHK